MVLTDFEGKTWSEVKQWIEENQMLLLFLQHGPEILKTHRDYGLEAATAVLSAYCHVEMVGASYAAVLAVNEYQKLSGGKLWRNMYDGVAWLGTSVPKSFSEWAVDVSELSNKEKGGYLNIVLKTAADKMAGTTTGTFAVARAAIYQFLREGMANASAVAESSHERVDV